MTRIKPFSRKSQPTDNATSDTSTPKKLRDRKRLFIRIGIIIISLIVIGGAVWWGIYSYTTPDKERTGEVAAEYRARLSDLKQATKDEPDNATARKDYAVALYATGYLKRAISEYESAININEKDANAYASIGNIYRDLEKYDKAIDYYNKSLEYNSAALNTYINLAAVQLYSLNDADAAIATYERGLEALPDNESLHLLVAIAQEKKGDTDAAIKTYQAILSRDSENAAARANLDRLNK